ncbi:Energy-coupling factor transporter ATP-binding protein EcfA2 [bioreactor metagenome]|uniref:Energy-coupling factor transporter ATP-binding protein EcfA2 n=1 Tax=bioreactor metagenome TaxID=1076179 RepID=A0A645CXA8_9ZZZZ
MEPEVLVLDEPTAGLDPKGRDKILNYIKDYQKQTGKTVVLVSHSMEDVAKLATKALVMNQGQVEMYGDIKEVYSHANRLVEIGLNVPQITKVFMQLKEKGYPVSSEIYTVEQGVKEILRLKKGGISS